MLYNILKQQIMPLMGAYCIPSVADLLFGFFEFISSNCSAGQGTGALALSNAACWTLEMTTLNEAYEKSFASTTSTREEDS
jgi:hypothetical protein